MRIGRSASILTILFVVAARAVGAQTSNQASVVFDRYMSPSAASEDLLTVQSELRTLEDRVLPLKFKDERRRLPLLAGVTYRAGRLMLLDVPQDHMLLVVAHEVFGHGARLRELGAGHISYSFD